MNERILLSNDDGITAPGLAVLERIANALSDEVWVCAPEQEQSGAGHSLTMRRPLRLREITPRRFAVDGTPTDCVLIALHEAMKETKPSLVLSGVNRGSNVAEDVTYSGTIAAAMEATLLGVPAIALSLRIGPGRPPFWATCERHGPDLIRRLLALKWPADVLININFPDCAPDEVAGVSVCGQGYRSLGASVERRDDMRGEPYYWVAPTRGAWASAPGTDIEILKQKRIAVTPLHLDLTHQPTLTALRNGLS